jgi:hypothetical protein
MREYRKSRHLGHNASLWSCHRYFLSGTAWAPLLHLLKWGFTRTVSGEFIWEVLKADRSKMEEENPVSG